ncbi:MAG: hypothetical protein KKB31_00920, partial [Nanoarchaeota archaeon]|nr:hypothetical protein [Nanoarchaeota archaeon]
MGAKKIWANIGKTVLTIASPPIGLVTWAKDKGGILPRAGIGVLVSIGACGVLSIGEVGKMSNEKIYDNPKLQTRTVTNAIYRGIPEFFLSPGVFYFDMHKRTSLQQAENEFLYVKGDDVITFSNGKYGLDFGQEREFWVKSESYPSIKKAQDRVDECSKTLQDWTKQGNFFESRKAKQDLTKARSELQEVQEKYKEARAAFQHAVDNMNSELED